MNILRSFMNKVPDDTYRYEGKLKIAVMGP